LPKTVITGKARSSRAHGWTKTGHWGPAAATAVDVDPLSPGLTPGMQGPSPPVALREARPPQAAVTWSHGGAGDSVVLMLRSSVVTSRLTSVTPVDMGNTAVVVYMTVPLTAANNSDIPSTPGTNSSEYLKSTQVVFMGKM